jgi:hypothetical protein
MAKPKIWGHCAAGCEWEVPHKEDFDTYRDFASQFPTPTLNAEKKLTEGSGYYLVRAVNYSGTETIFSGVIYWEEGVVTLLSSKVMVGGETATALYVTNGYVDTDGAIKYNHQYLYKDHTGSMIDITEEYTIYTAKIKDVTVPDIAEEESY